MGSPPKKRGVGAGSSRRHADTARAIKQFLRTTLSTTSTIELLAIGPVQNAAAISQAVGFPVVGFSLVLENGTARHTLRHHGDPATEAKRGQMAVGEADLALMGQILSEFDRVEPADPTKQGAAQVRLHKTFGAIGYEVYAEVRRSAEQLAFKTMIKRQVKAEMSS